MTPEPAKSAPRYDAVLQTPFSLVGLCFENSRLIALDYLEAVDEKPAVTRIARQASEQILRYCDDARDFRGFTIDIDARGTDFQRKVLQALLEIPCGCTRTYGQIAKQLRTSPRAVGNACRRNPVPLIIPCHRVVAASGPGGYDGATAGPLLDMKLRLLKHEAAI
ncbi:MAG TPA: methylated-DNA--[protein]-cysteine S-methyltransferase [Thiotrichales bacterium]|nr:methylated-DNA--[protein]-cysteine S-methyltransferase [Thiotrichales bacterium]